MSVRPRVWAEIDLDAIRENVRAQKEHLKRNGCEPKCLAVVKADGYGHGASHVAAAIKDLVWGFAVATAEEAFSLRDEGITAPILILGFTDESDFPRCIKEKIRLTVYEPQAAQRLSAAAVRYREEFGEGEAIAHIKLDTGMGRIGFLAYDGFFEESLAQICSACKLPGIRYEGIFTHFATADDVVKTFANLQHNRFLKMCDALSDRGVNFEIKHCCNSAAVIDRPGWAADMVRLGISMYGLYPSEYVDRLAVCLHPAMTLRSRIIHIKELPAGIPISYGSTFVTGRPTRVATISAGYADGYPRMLSGKAEVLVGGRRARILGRICMDQMMIDVTGLEAVEGDTVTLLGRDTDERISAEELGNISGRFNYELVCDVSKRVVRIYKGGDA